MTAYLDGASGLRKRRLADGPVVPETGGGSTAFAAPITELFGKLGGQVGITNLGLGG
jgi:hypothetical protein